MNDEDKASGRAKVSNIIFIACNTIYNYFRYKTAAALCDKDLIFALSINIEEEIGYSERSANWAEIKALVEDDAHEKRKLIFSPGVSQGPGQWLTFQMLFQFTIMINKDVFLLYYYEHKTCILHKLKPSYHARWMRIFRTVFEEQEEESVLHSYVDSEPRLDDDSEEPSLRAVRKQRLTCTNLLSCVASFLKFNLISKF
jgi:hypothetical protein